MARKKRNTGGPIVNERAPKKDNITFLEDEEENEFAAAMDQGHRIDPRAQKIFIMFVILLALLVFGLLVPKNLFNEALQNGGSNNGYSFAWFVEDLMYNVNGLVGVLTGHDDYIPKFSNDIILYIVIALTGAGLAICGAAYQGSFKNALVSPSTLGVTNGATMGMMVWVVFFVADDGSNVGWLDTYAGSDNLIDSILATYALSFIEFIGCLLVVGVVLLTVRLAGKGSTSAILMIIAGQCIGSVMGAVSNCVRYWYLAQDPYGVKADLLTSLQIASFYRTYSLLDVIAVGIPLIATFAVVMLLRRRMMLLTFSEDEARTMGVDSKKMQYLVVGLCTLLTAILISFCGRIGFVGFLVPHLARRLVGPNFSYLFPATAVMGAVFVVAAYVLVMMILGPEYETMVGMFISIFGSGVFLVTALRGKGGARGEFR